jgi:hypothetical protein
MSDVLRELLRNHFEAAFCTLCLCLEQCPDELWQEPVGNEPFSRVVFHTLFFADMYLSTDEDSFRQQQFHIENADLFGDYEQLEWRDPVCIYEREPLRNYLNFCRSKATGVISAESDESLAAPCGFPRRDFSRAELHVYSMRHIQHHAAQLSLRLRLSADVGIPWVGSGWQD